MFTLIYLIWFFLCPCLAKKNGSSFTTIDGNKLCQKNKPFINFVGSQMPFEFHEVNSSVFIWYNIFLSVFIWLFVGCCRFLTAFVGFGR